jgi:hypothetical protein
MGLAGVTLGLVGTGTGVAEFAVLVGGTVLVAVGVDALTGDAVEVIGGLTVTPAAGAHCASIKTPAIRITHCNIHRTGCERIRFIQ